MKVVIEIVLEIKHHAIEIKETSATYGSSRTRSTLRKEDWRADECGSGLQQSRQREFDFEAGDARSLHEEIQAQLDQ